MGVNEKIGKFHWQTGALSYQHPSIMVSVMVARVNWCQTENLDKQWKLRFGVLKLRELLNNGKLIAGSFFIVKQHKSSILYVKHSLLHILLSPTA